MTGKAKQDSSREVDLRNRGPGEDSSSRGESKAMNTSGVDVRDKHTISRVFRDCNT